ncbi:MAG: enoyl-CoA hydratase/isomerase family protein [Desulfobacteraceae bacterium]|nr:enoyl-CoA hydratase/isomerase family protein [Desulfobacteraceae bacterium]
MNYENIIVEIGDDFVAEITLNRPGSLNTFNIPLAKELDHAFYELDNDNQARVIILKGAGKAFCAGIDISAFLEKRSPEWKLK